MDRKRIVVLVGPTAVGKSALAMRIADSIPLEIVSADSMQVYRGMDIGTGKPSPEERRRVPHHLVDLVDPDVTFHAGRFQREADRAIDGILRRGRLPLVVGGTGLYVKALLHGLFGGEGEEQGKDNKEELSFRDTWLYENPHVLLEKLDPAAARRIHPNDPVRARRALVVLSRTGRSITSWQEEHGFRENRYEAKVIGLTMDRADLFERIEARVEAMMAEGLLDEVSALLERGFSPDLPSMRGLGYRHMVKVLRGEWDREEGIRLLKRDTRRYAKRQWTWFRHQEDVAWFDASRGDRPILDTIREFLARL